MMWWTFKSVALMHKSNAVIYAFMENKKFTLSNSKCHKIHYGKKSQFCSVLEEHKENIHVTDKEKYLGDYINKNEIHATNVSRRRAKGFGIYSYLIMILDLIRKVREESKLELNSDKPGWEFTASY